MIPSIDIESFMPCTLSMPSTWLARPLILFYASLEGQMQRLVAELARTAAMFKMPRRIPSIREVPRHLMEAHAPFRILWLSPALSY